VETNITAIERLCTTQTSIHGINYLLSNTTPSNISTNRSRTTRGRPESKV